MDKFILGENPMRPSDESCYIIHLLNPIAIIQAREGLRLKRKGEDAIFKTFEYVNIDGVLEYWTLSIHHFFTTDFLKEPNEQAFPLLERAWRWYRSYLEFEDKNIRNDQS